MKKVWQIVKKTSEIIGIFVLLVFVLKIIYSVVSGNFDMARVQSEIINTINPKSFAQDKDAIYDYGNKKICSVDKVMTPQGSLSFGLIYNCTNPGLVEKGSLLEYQGQRCEVISYQNRSDVFSVGSHLGQGVQASNFIREVDCKLVE